MPGYEGASSESSGTPQPKDDRITLKGKWCFTYKPRRLPRGAAARRKHQATYLATMEQRGFKIGIKIKNSQVIERLSFAGSKGDVVMQEDAGVSQELEAAFGSDANEKWVGLVPPSGARRKHTFRDATTICYQYVLIIKFVKHKPQPVPVVLTYRDGDFSKHYLLDVRILSDREKTIQTVVKAIV